MEEAKAAAKKPTGRGRRRIPIRKIESKEALQVAFSKRRSGLFKKAAELSILCGAEVAIIAFSPGGKPFSFGHPSVDSTIDRFLFNPSSSSTDGTFDAEQQSELQQQVNATAAAAKEGGFWWEAPIDGMGMEELLRMLNRLEEFKKVVTTRADELWWKNCLIREGDSSFSPPLLI